MSSYLEHHPYITLNDDTEITYSGIKTGKNGEYITMYFETPDSTFGFKSMDIDYPGGVIHHREHYTREEVRNLYYYYKKYAALAFDFAKEKREEENRCRP